MANPKVSFDTAMAISGRQHATTIGQNDGSYNCKNFDAQMINLRSKGCEK